MATDSGNHSDGLCFPRLTQPKPFEIHPSTGRAALVVRLSMNRVEPLDESVGTNSTALMDSPEVAEVQVKDVPADYVNLEDTQSLDNAQNSADTLEKTESPKEEKESEMSCQQDNFIFNSNRSISDR